MIHGSYVLESHCEHELGNTESLLAEELLCYVLDSLWSQHFCQHFDQDITLFYVCFGLRYII